MWTYFAIDGFCFVLCLSFERNKNEKGWNIDCSGSSQTCRLPLTSSQILVLHESYPAKSPIFLPTMRWNPVPFDRLRSKIWPAFDYKKIRDGLNNTRSGNYGFVKLKNHENAIKQSERTPSVRTLGPCGAAMAKKKNLLRSSSFLLRRSPSNVRSVMRLHRILIGLSWLTSMLSKRENGLYMHRLQESRSQSTIYRSTEFEVTTSLRRDQWLSVRAWS